MFRKLRNALLVSLAVFMSGLAAMPLPVMAQNNKAQVCEGIAATGGDCNAGDSQINNVIAGVINVMSVLVGVVSVIMIIIGGFKYVTSNGDSGQVSSAKNTILYAIVGIIVVVMAQAIVTFVLDRAT